MGWSYVRKPTDVKRYLSDLFTFESDTHSSRTLMCKIVKVRTAYLAVEHHIKATDERRIWGVVVLLDYQGRPGYEFGYKDVDETMGPCETECPRDVLELLTPLYSAQVYRESWDGGQWERDARDRAKRWRRQCWSNVRRREEAKKIKPGDRLRFAYPLSVGYLRYNTFEYVGTAKRGWGRTCRNVFRPVGEDGIVLRSYEVRIPAWRELSYQIVTI